MTERGPKKRVDVEMEVLTATSPECQVGECEKCEGILHDEEHGDTPIFCIHDCHKVRNMDN
jgi:hypothetical protein